MVSGQERENRRAGGHLRSAAGHSARSEVDRSAIRGDREHLRHFRGYAGQGRVRSDRGVWGFARLGLPVLLLFACGEPPRAAGFRILADAWVDAEARTGRITVHVEIKLPYAGAGEYTLKAEVAGPAGRASGSATGALKTKGGRAAGSIE